MSSLFRKFGWWLRRRRKEEELRAELQFHLEEDADEGRADGLSEEQARQAARRALGNVTLLREDTRTLWTWAPLEQLAQDLRYAVRMMAKHRAFTLLAALSLALGIGANTAIYSFMDSILLRSLPVSDPASLAVVKWHAKPYTNRPSASSEFVLRSIDGRTYGDAASREAYIFPYPAFERLQEASAPVFSSLFGYFWAGQLNVLVKGAAELTPAHYVTGDFFQGLELSPAAGRVLMRSDDLAGAPPVAVISMGYSQRRFGGPANAINQQILINNIAFTVVGVAPPEFFGVDPAVAPHVYLPMHAMSLLDSEQAAPKFVNPNYYWILMMGRLRPGVTLEQAQAVLAPQFAQWVVTTASNDQERANLPVLQIGEGAGGLDSLRRQYSKPLYVLLAMVGLILAIACANTANLLLARAATRHREMAVRLSIGAGRFRLVRQLLTESMLLASLSGVLGIFIAVIGIRVLTALLANGQEGFTLHAELNWHVLAVTLGLSLLCGLIFGLAPALHATRTALASALRDRSITGTGTRVRGWIARPSLTQVLVAAQIAISLLLLVAAGLFGRTLANLQSIQLGFNREGVLLFELNAPQAGVPESRVTAFYTDLRNRLTELPGVRDVTLSHSSLIRAGRSFPVLVDGQVTQETRILYTGPRFFATMQIPMLRGREILESDREGALPVVVVSDLFAKKNFGDADPIGRRVVIRGGILVSKDSPPIVAEIVGIAAHARYGPLKRDVPPVVYFPYAQIPPLRLQGMTYALRTDGDPLRHAASIRQIVRDADERVPVINIKTLATDIDQTINQEIVFARLCTTFAGLALLIACVGLYATMTYTVARRTSEIGIRMALGARRGTVIWMVLREVCVLVAVGLAISIPIVRGTSRLIESLLFEMKGNDPGALTLAMAVLLIAALVAAYGPARRASRVDPMIALRHE
jgi:macrolide transport system ATP-binding/permease protein